MYRMLIVDDEERIVNSLYGFFSAEFDFEIHRAFSAMDAEKLLRKMRFDLILSDISMPQMSGLELLDAAKRLWPKCHFILLTAYNNFDYAYCALKYDRVDYLLKVESYDVIKAVIQKKLALLEEERQEQARLPGLARNLQEMHANMNRYFLKRVIVQGTAFPEQRDLDAVETPIDLSRPVLLALGRADGDALPERDQALMAAQEYIKGQLEGQGMGLLSYLSSGRALWAIQAVSATSAYTEEELALFAREALNQLSQLTEENAGRGLALLCAEGFVPWAEAHALYQRAQVRLEWMRHENGMVLLPLGEDVCRTPARRPFPDLEEVTLLWDIFKRGERDSFLREMARGLAPLRRPDAPPAASLAAVALLFSEASALYGAGQTPEMERLLSGPPYAAGTEWADAALRAAEGLFEMREIARQDTDTWLIRQVDAYLEGHFAQDITLTTLAEAVHYNPSYLSRFYKQQTGKNLMSRLYEVRIDHAKRLLRQSGAKTMEISEQCGFCSTKYFNQVFKKATGYTPNDFREMSQKN